MTAMRMPPRLRKLSLTAHITASVGWLGAVASSLALALAGSLGRDAQAVRAAYLTMEMIGWYVLVPLSLASLATGVVQSLGTRWGLVRHHWVLAKLAMNVFAIVILLLYTQALSALAGAAAKVPFTGDDLSELKSPSPALHGAAALLLLLVAVALSVFKPPGMTRYGVREQRQARADVTPHT